MAKHTVYPERAFCECLELLGGGFRSPPSPDLLRKPSTTDQHSQGWTGLTLEPTHRRRGLCSETHQAGKELAGVTGRPDGCSAQPGQRSKRLSLPGGRGTLGGTPPPRGQQFAFLSPSHVPCVPRLDCPFSFWGIVGVQVSAFVSKAADTFRVEVFVWLRLRFCRSRHPGRAAGGCAWSPWPGALGARRGTSHPDRGRPERALPG